MALELRFTIPGQVAEVVPLSEQRMIVGTLLSNHVVLRASGVDPIHAMLEEENGDWLLTDLGSSTGVKVNGKKVDVETKLKAGDRIEIGGVALEVVAVQEKQAAPAPIGIPLPTQKPTVPPVVPPRTPTQATPTVAQVERRQEETASDGTKKRKDVLFSPREAQPSGDVLEVVAYWGDTVLDVDMFHPSIKGNEVATIGDPTVSHFISAGQENLTRHVLAAVGSEGYKLRMTDGMEGRIRKGGKVETFKDKNSLSLGRRDIAHIKYGAVRYFLLFIKPPALALPPSGVKDPFFAALMGVALAIYFLIIPALWLSKPIPKENEKDDFWTIVQVPEKNKPEPKPEPEKKKVELAKVEKPKPTPTPPKPVEPKPTPVKPIEPEKTKPIPTPKPPAEKMKVTDTLKAPEQPDNKDKGKPGPKGAEGMPSTGAKKPDFKLAGQPGPGPLGPSGGPEGSGMNQMGGARKGTGKYSVMGVEGVDNNKPSGVNLSKLGIGVGKVLSKTGAGAIYTNFKSSAGGAGGGMGSASKTYGLGGVGTGKSLGLAGSGSAVNNFGSGSGGILSGQGGTGGLGGAGLGKAFGTGGGGEGGQGGRGRANVSVPESDPVVSGGLTPQEILAVIRANLNQIRHCYEQLLQRSPNSSGKMSVTFVVGLNGRVTSANITNTTISDAMMQGCVAGKIRRWAFPQPRGGQPVTVTYPFVFNPV